MALILDTLVEILRKPTIGDVLSELALFAAPLWIATMVGIMVGWAWRPEWVADSGETTSGRRSPAPEASGSVLSLDSLKGQLPSCVASFISGESSRKELVEISNGSLELGDEKLAVTAEDLDRLCLLVDERDGGPAWHHMMEKSLPNMSYQAWKREPETGPPQYRSSTIFENATPDIVRDFFWDDEFRMKNKWDDMLLYHETLEECPKTGTMVVHWIRKFPFFCSNREYTIGRRIWDSGRTYYCVTKGVPCPSVPRRSRPRRVDLYYSSWCIRAVDSRRGEGEMSACEVLLFHHEDMGIPWEIAKIGVRKGMWGCVKKIEPGLRAYQISKISGDPPSRSALMARVNTRVDSQYLRSLESGDDGSSGDLVEEEVEKQKPWGLTKVLVVGGVVALACTVDHGLFTKAVIFGVARRLGRRL